MSAAKRWAVVALGVSLLAAAPFVARAWPTPSTDLSASDLLERIRGSSAAPYYGRVESRGGVELPTDESLSSVAKLLGRDGVLRVWWAGPDEWRVSTLRTTGETDLIHRDQTTLRWVYESKRVTLSPDVPVRLPNSTDVLPPLLARRILEGAHADEVSRLPTKRVAGTVAVGLRLVPSDVQSSVDHVDVWAEEKTGIPLEVELFDTPDGPSTLATSFVDIELTKPDNDALRFTPPVDSSVHYDDTVDLAAAADKYAGRPVPETLAELPARVQDVRSVGVYGRGPTVLIAVPVRAKDAEELRRSLRARPDSVCLPRGDEVTAGPLEMLVTSDRFNTWLLAGTVTRDAMRKAGRDIEAYPFAAFARAEAFQADTRRRVRCP